MFYSLHPDTTVDQSFIEFLADSFCTEAEMTWKLLSTTCVQASFPVHSIRVEVRFEQKEEQGPWHVAFVTEWGEAEDFRNEMSGFRILNGVFQAVRQFVETREPEALFLIAKDEDRARVYAAYLRREQVHLEEMGYKIEGPIPVRPYTEWTLRRMKPSAWVS